MKRRDSLKTIMAGAIAGATLTTVGCRGEVAEKATDITKSDLYGRTPSEKAWDEKLRSETFFTDHEMETITTLSDIILPAKGDAGSATDAGVPDFIEFIVKDLPDHQLPMRGGLMWLDTEANNRFNLEFVKCSKAQQLEIIEDIAYPLNDENTEFSQGIKFFDRMRDLTLTGYYTSKMGVKDLGYKGNVPNVWDGVPEEVLADLDVDYEPEWIAKCIDQSRRDIQAKWDDEMNLIT